MLEFKNPKARAWLETRRAALLRAETLEDPQAQDHIRSKIAPSCLRNAIQAELMHRVNRGEFKGIFPAVEAQIAGYQKYRRMTGRRPPILR